VNTVLAKLDGPEFAILVNDYLHESDLASQANLIDYFFRKPIEINSEKFLISPRIGISVAGENESPDHILRNAATAMLHAEEHNETAYVYHNQAMNLQVQNQIRLENNISKELRTKSLLIIISLKFVCALASFVVLKLWCAGSILSKA